MTIVENRKHTFAVSDLGDFDLDQDRSIVPSIKFALKNQGINADVDGKKLSTLNNVTLQTAVYMNAVLDRKIVLKCLD